MWAKHNLVANPEPRPIDLVMYRTKHLEDQVKRLREDLEFMKNEFKKQMDEKKEKKKEEYKVVSGDNSWWWA